MNLRTIRWLVLLVTLAGFAWRVHGLAQQSLWRDEVDAVYFALRPLDDTLSMFRLPAQNGPLYFLALRPWLQWAGATEFALRYPSAMAGVLGIPLIWQVARRLLPPGPRARLHASADSPTGDIRGPSPEPAGVSQPATADNNLYAATPAPEESPDEALAPWLATLFFAVNPYQLWYGQEGKMYSGITALVLLATWCWLVGVERGGWRPWLAYLGSVSVAMYAHLLSVLLIPLHLIWFVIAWPQSRRHRLGYALTLAGLTLPYLPMVWWQWELLITDERKTGFSFTPLTEMVQVIILNHMRGFLPPAEAVWLAPIFFLGMAGLVLGVGEIGAPRHGALPHLAAWRRFGLVLAWFAAPVGVIYLLSLRQPVFTDRYLIWVGPALLMVLALGVSALRSNAGRLGNLLAIIAVVYLVGYWAHAGWQQKSQPTKYDLASAVGYIVEHRTPGSLLILQIPHMEYAYRYYSSDFGSAPFQESDARLGAWMGGLWTNNGLADDLAYAQVEAQMQQQTAGYRDLWVLRSEVEMWDPRYLMDRWLDAHGTLVDQAHFTGAQVRHYVLNP